MGRFFSSCHVFALWATFVPALGAAPAAAEEHRSTCNARAAALLRMQGDGFRDHAAYARAAAAYRSASRRLEGCPDASAALRAAYSLAQAGASFAQAGDYVAARALLIRAQDRLKATAARDPKLAAAAQTYVDRVQNVISALDDVARSSM